MLAPKYLGTFVLEHKGAAVSILAISLRFYQTQLALFPDDDFAEAQRDMARKLAGIIIARGC